MAQFVKELRPHIERVFDPLLEFLEQRGVSPNFVTVCGFILVLVGSLMLYLDIAIVAFVFLLFGALSDAIDGALARRLKKSSTFGAFFDSLFDRFSDAAPLIAIALRDQGGILSVACMLAIVFSFSVSYARARAEGLGFDLKSGIFERTERWVVLLSGIVLSIFYQDAILWSVSLLALGGLITTVQRVISFRNLLKSGGLR